MAMDQMYLRNSGRRGRSKGKTIFMIVLLAHLAAAGAYWYFKVHKPKAENAVEGPVAEDPIFAPEETLPAITEVTPQIQQVINQARTAMEAEQFPTARKLLNELLDSNLPEATERQVIDLLGEVNIKLLVSPIPMAEKQYYTIQSGDSLGKISVKYNTTVELLKKMNGMRTDNIRLGDRMLVFTGTFTIKVSKTLNELDLLLDGRIFKRYNVGTGKYGKTPAVEFKIVDKISKPTWWKDNRPIEFGDPENLLGTRWMKIMADDHPEITGFGIHGTWERDSIGSQSSAGCVRMLNEEVEELFDLVPRQTTVIITE